MCCAVQDPSWKHCMSNMRHEKVCTSTCREDTTACPPPKHRPLRQHLARQSEHLDSYMYREKNMVSSKEVAHVSSYIYKVLTIKGIPTLHAPKKEYLDA